jgi:hypothetical protein
VESIKINKTVSSKHYFVNLTELVFLNSSIIKVFGTFEQNMYITQCMFLYTSGKPEFQGYFENNNGEIIHKFDIFNHFGITGCENDYTISYTLEFSPLSEDRIIENVLSAYNNLLSKIENNYTEFQKKLKSINDDWNRLITNIKNQIDNIKGGV